YRFTPDPNGRWQDASIVCDATGWPQQEEHRENIFSWLKDKALRSGVAGLARRVPDANWFEMIATVTTCGRPTVAIGHGQCAQTPWRSTASGPLFFFANDARLGVLGHDFYANNKGVIDVTIERVA
ncbi:MAG: hypothetical protein ACJ8HU_03565, partial [Chthoniobacterales bacterium]